MYVYGVNPEGSEEAYTHLSIEGPIYSGDASYKELIAGLSEKTDYAVQIVAYDANDDAIAYSSLIDFCTISRQEAMESSSSSSGDIPDRRVRRAVRLCPSIRLPRTAHRAGPPFRATAAAARWASAPFLFLPPRAFWR